MSLPSGSNDFPLGLHKVNIEGKEYIPESIGLPKTSARLIQQYDETGNPDGYQIRASSQKITGSITVQRKDTAYQLSSTPRPRHTSYQPKSGQKLFYSNPDGIYFCTITDVKNVRSKDSADLIELGVLLDYFSPSSLDLNVNHDYSFASVGIALQPSSVLYLNKNLVEIDLFLDNNHPISANEDTDLLTDQFVDGVNRALFIRNNAYSTHQLYLNDSAYKNSKSGRVEFNYYVPSGSTLVGKYFHIGSYDENFENTYTKQGHQIVGGTWTSATLLYGKEFGGEDKPTNSNLVLHTHLDEDFATSDNGVAHNGNTADVSFTINQDNISDGTTSKNNTAKVQNVVQKVPQLRILGSTDYSNSTSGEVTFTYYVPENHPIVGGYWHIGTGATSSGIEISYSPYGVKIIGGKWTTATVKYGSHYGGLDKDNGFRLLTILSQKYADGKANPVYAQAGDAWYITDLKLSAITTPSNPTFSGSFIVYNTTGNTYDGTYTYNSSSQRWQRDSTHYFKFNSSLNKWQYIYGSNTLTATTSMLTPWFSGWTDDLGNFDFFKGNVVETGGIESNLNRAFLTITNSETAGDSNILVKNFPNLGFYIKQTQVHAGYESVDFTDCGNWWIDTENQVSELTFGYDNESLWQINIPDDNVDKKIGIIPANAGEITISLALRLGNFYRAEVDLNNSSSHVISYTTNSDGEFIASGMNATKIQKFDIVIDTDEPNDPTIEFDLIYDP